MDTSEHINRLLGFDLKFEDNKVVWEFVVLWNLFEHRICDDYFKPNEVDKYAAGISQDSIDEVFSFFKNRYVSGSETNENFESLFPPHKTRKEEVANFLLMKGTSKLTTVAVSILIVYRVRCNLFHGIKTTEMWEKQQELFKNANRLLLSILQR